MKSWSFSPIQAGVALVLEGLVFRWLGIFFVCLFEADHRNLECLPRKFIFLKMWGNFLSLSMPGSQRMPLDAG